MARSVRILHVDDDADFVEVAAAFLERENDRFEVVTETSAQDGLDRLAAERIDCVVSDYRMPEVDGLAFLERVRSRRPDLPFVLLTGEGPEAVGYDAVAAGATDYLQKNGRTERLRLLAHRIETAVDAERARRERDRYRTLVETVGDPMYMLDPDGRVTTANDAMAAMLECDRDRIVGTHASEFLAEGDFERGTDLIVDVLSEAERDWRTYEVTVETTTGGRFPAEINVAPVLDEGDDYAATVGVVRDISERKRRERRLGALHDTTRTLVDAVDREAAVTAAVDAADEVLDLNVAAFYAPDADGEAMVPLAATDGARSLFGTVPTMERGAGLLWRAYEDGEAVFAGDVRDYGETYNPDTPVRSEMLIPAADHGVFVAASTAVDEFDDVDEDLAHVLVSNLRCALDSVSREERLRERERSLQRENDRLETFARIVSHDLRNPLTLADGRLELAREECASDSLEDVARALDRIEAITDDMLTMASEGGTVEERERVDLASLADRCWGALDTGDATLAVADPPVVSADPDRLRHVFENLYRNAVEHGSTSPDSQARRDAVEHGSTSPPSHAPENAGEHGSADSAADSGVTVTVGGLAGRDGFYVADDGAGVPPGERERVFESGYSTSESGTGFGLEIVKQLVEAHGWTVALTESDDGGARFEVTGVDVVE